jgi:hypothetical protein
MVRSKHKLIATALSRKSENIIKGHIIWFSLKFIKKENKTEIQALIIKRMQIGKQYKKG